MLNVHPSVWYILEFLININYSYFALFSQSATLKVLLFFFFF